VPGVGAGLHRTNSKRSYQEKRVMNGIIGTVIGVLLVIILVVVVLHLI